MNTAPNNLYDQDFEQFITDCETLMEVAVSKQFDANESFVILLAAKHLNMIAANAINMFEMDITLDNDDKVAKSRLFQAKECSKCIAAIINRMQANMLLADINLN